MSFLCLSEARVAYLEFIRSAITSEPEFALEVAGNWLQKSISSADVSKSLRISCLFIFHEISFILLKSVSQSGKHLQNFLTV